MKVTIGIFAATIAASSLVQAGEYIAPTSPKMVVEPMAVEEVDVLSGGAALDVNTHFISYGLDVWGAGSSWRDALFNPSAEIAIAFGEVNLLLGSWWDVNDNAESSIGGSVQEIDLWIGLNKSFGMVDATIYYQEWMYGGTSERIVDLILGFDVFLSPSITVHGRVDAGASGGDTGVVTVLGIEPGTDLGPVSVSLPVGVGFATDGFHGGDSGYAYTYVGLGASLPLAFMGSTYGEWDVHAGVTYYNTNDSVIPGNPDDNFVTGTIGIGVSF